MVEKISKEMRSKIMRSIRSKNTKPEITVRKILTQLGYRYRLHKRNLPGNPDIVFIGKKKAIFVHGCFWHGHTDCRIARIPENEYWQLKLKKNQDRDLQSLSRLQEMGWTSLIIWECEITDLVATQDKLRQFLAQ